MKVVQIVDGRCAWVTHHKNLGETVGLYPTHPDPCVFVEAPDIVNDGNGNPNHAWLFREQDDDGNWLMGDARFIPPTPGDGEVYIPTHGIIVPEEDYVKYLDEAKLKRQDLNKKCLNDFLTSHTLTWTDGKKYGVSLEDQSEMQLNMTQYQLQVAANMENPVLEWHAVHEPCQPWTLENLTKLAFAVSKFVMPWFHKMNDIKGEIFSATTIEEVNAIELEDVYMTDEDREAKEAAKLAEEQDRIEHPEKYAGMM